MTVVVFDLDDTLYDEWTYVKSGLSAVANDFAKIYGFDKDSIFQWLWERIQTEGRGAIFDDLLKKHGLYNKGRVRKLLSVYRLHEPKIELDPEAVACLDRLKGFPLYVVTDGNKEVQHRKLAALGLYERMNHCFVTHRYGVKNAKPSPYCFLKIVEREKADPGKIVYIGDNPRKDFVGIKKFGFRTIRIMKGQHKTVNSSEEYEAERQIASLSEIDERYLRMMMQ